MTYPVELYFGQVAGRARPLPAPPSDGLVPLATSFTAAVVDVPATNHRIRVSGPGGMVGSVELLSQSDGAHLVVGEMEWFQPPMMVESVARQHFAAVVDRLLVEAIALASRSGASLTWMTPGSLVTAERLRDRGFRQAGDMWLWGRA